MLLSKYNKPIHVAADEAHHLFKQSPSDPLCQGCANESACRARRSDQRADVANVIPPEAVDPEMLDFDADNRDAMTGNPLEDDISLLDKRLCLVDDEDGASDWMREFLEPGWQD